MPRTPRTHTRDTPTPAYVPKLKPRYMRVLGVTITDKTFTYILGLQLALNDGLQSLVPAAAGLAAGAMYRSDVLGLRRFLIPAPIAAAAETVCMPFLASDPPGAAAARRRAQQERMQALYQAQLARMGIAPAAAAAGGAMRGTGALGRGAAGAGRGVGAGAAAAAPPVAGAPAMAPAAAEAALPPPPAPSEESVARLVGMGFGRDAVLAALRAAYNNEEAAVHRLLQ